MVLKSFGCSFIFGTDLRDDGRSGPYPTPSQLTWPALLAKELGYQYVCYAYPGSGNLRILENVISQSAASNEKDLFVIGWTWIDRFDYTRTVEEWREIIPDSTIDKWSTLMPIDDTKEAKFYYKNLHSQYRDKLTTLIYIKSVIDVLKNKKIPFIMTNMDDIIWESRYHATPVILDTQDYIRHYISDFENKTFLEFSRDKGFKISDTLHPLEEAHQCAFETVNGNLSRYIKNRV